MSFSNPHEVAVWASSGPGRGSLAQLWHSPPGRQTSAESGLFPQSYAQEEGRGIPTLLLRGPNGLRPASPTSKDFTVVSLPKQILPRLLDFGFSCTFKQGGRDAILLQAFTGSFSWRCVRSPSGSSYRPLHCTLSIHCMFHSLNHPSRELIERGMQLQDANPHL